jgi:hypothetical protein
MNRSNISQIPGGGVGIFNGCTNEWGAPSAGWGAQYGGISDQSACDSFPEALKAGCKWRYDWFMGADNPTVSFTQVACPAALTANTGCARADDAGAPAPASASPVASYSTSPVASPSSSPAAQEPAPTTYSPQPEPVATTSSAAAQAPSSSSAPAAVTSAPSASGGIFLQPQASNITTPVPSSTTSAALEVVTVTIDACEAQYPL